MPPNPQSFEPNADNTRDLRRAFGCFGTGVTVVTAQRPEGPLAMTANSFSSVSLDPALVLWSPAKSSKRYDAFINALHFCIHILATDQLKMAEHFASNGTDFSIFEWTEGPGGAPTLVGCLAEFHCDTYAVHPAGDHSVVLGLIQHVIHHDREASGLLFECGKFGQHADIITTDQ